jgi:hypothetical protein
MPIPKWNWTAESTVATTPYPREITAADFPQIVDIESFIFGPDKWTATRFRQLLLNATARNVGSGSV